MVGFMHIRIQNVQRRILARVIVIFIPVFVLIRAVLWEGDIKSAVNLTVVVVNAKVVQIPELVLLAVLIEVQMSQLALCNALALG